MFNLQLENPNNKQTKINRRRNKAKPSPILLITTSAYFFQRQGKQQKWQLMVLYSDLGAEYLGSKNNPSAEILVNRV